MAQNRKKHLLRTLALILASAMLVQTPVYAEETGAKGSAAGAAKNDEKDALHNLPTEWDLTQFYANEEEFNKAMDRALELIPAYEKYRGTLKDKAGILKFLQDKDLKELKEISQTAEMYAIALTAKDASDPLARRVKARTDDVDAKQAAASAFVDPQIAKLPLETRQEIFADPDLVPYAYANRRLTDPNGVILDEKSKNIYDLMREGGDRYRDIFNIFNNTELPLPTVTLPDRSKKKLTETLLVQIVSNPNYDHDFKAEIAEKRLDTRVPFENTYASMLEGAMKSYWASAQAYGFDSSLEYACHDMDVDPKIYTKIIDSAHAMLPLEYEYYKIKKEKSGLEDFYIFDVSLPSSSYKEKKVDYEDAVNTGRNSLRVWGSEYLSVFDKIITNPLIDVYPGEKKRGGAFEKLTGKKTLPMVCFNYNGLESYAGTIVHEMGHAVYSEFSAENQEAGNDYPTVFTQEVASTANECMLYKDRIRNAETKEEKIFWLEKEIDMFINTILRQCMNSEFEDYCYKRIEAGKNLSAQEMDGKYKELLKEYYGGDVKLFPNAGSDWTRIPHFYYHYYMYQYATSLTYAAAICQRVEDEGEDAVDDYIAFLKLGNSASPEELLKTVGVDPLDGETYRKTCQYLQSLIDQYRELVEGDPGPTPEKPADSSDEADKKTTGSGTDEKKKAVVKKANPIRIRVSKKTFSRKKLKKAKTFLIGVRKAKGKVTYTLNRKAKKAKIKVNKKGKVTVPKKCRKGTYKITVNAAGNRKYKAGRKIVTIKVKK